MNDSESNAYKTLIVGELVQKTALSIGGNAPHAMVDAPLCRNGLHWLTLRGSSLAGALIATARKIYRDPLPSCITEGTPQQQDSGMKRRLHETVWRVFTSHVLPLDNASNFAAPKPEIRPGVGILQRTSAAAENVRFDTETIPAGTCWWFCMEIDDYRDPTGTALSVAVQSLDEWRRGYCWLGRDVARGLGWMELAGPRLIRLTTDDIARWPDARQAPWQTIEALNDRHDSEEWSRLASLDEPHRRTQHRLRGHGIIRVGLDDRDGDSYGMELLSVGSTEAMRGHQSWDANHYLKPEDLGEAEAEAEFDPDQVLAWTADYGPDGVQRPNQVYIPGSSLRGPMRHMLSWWLRSREGKTVWDPNSREKSPSATEDDVAALFGTTQESAALIVSDAALCSDDYQLALLELHAEDEFTAGAYDSSKFNRLCLIKASFAFEFLVEAVVVDKDDGINEIASAEKLGRYRELLGILQRLGEQRFLPLGGGKWRGNGWVHWQLELDEPDRATPVESAIDAETTVE